MNKYIIYNISFLKKLLKNIYIYILKFGKYYWNII